MPNLLTQYHNFSIDRNAGVRQVRKLTPRCQHF